MSQYYVNTFDIICQTVFYNFLWGVGVLSAVLWLWGHARQFHWLGVTQIKLSAWNKGTRSPVSRGRCDTTLCHTECQFIDTSVSLFRSNDFLTPIYCITLFSGDMLTPFQGVRYDTKRHPRVILSEVLSGSLFTSKTDDNQNCGDIVYNVFALANLICKRSEQINPTQFIPSI